MRQSIVKWRVKAILKYAEYLKEKIHALLTGDSLRGWPKVGLSIRGRVPVFSRALCIFATYDRDSCIRPNIFAYIEALVAVGFDIVLVSTSPTIGPSDLQRLLGLCICIVSRENRGYDFFSWKTGMLQYEDYMLHSGLLLANDSVYGPLFDIGDLIKKIESDPADIVGMTDGTRFSYHLQSYFLYFKKRVITSRRFVDFFRKVRAESYKESIIRKYEIGISRALGRQFELSAIFALERVLSKVNYHKRPRDWINLTVHLWRELILDFHFPFLKKSIAASGAASRDEITKLLAEAGSPYDPALLNL